LDDLFLSSDSASQLDALTTAANITNALLAGQTNHNHRKNPIVLGTHFIKKEQRIGLIDPLLFFKKIEFFTLI
jgi:hypothetical protein